MYTKDDLLAQLRAMGIKSTDTVTVHTALRSVGKLDAGDKTGAEVYIDALAEAVKDGILMVPTHTWANVREAGDVFDIRNTMPCIGAVPTAAAKLAAKAHDVGDRTCLRTMHPTHSAVIFGREAEEFSGDELLAYTPAPWEGIYGKLCRWGGKILLVGVDQGRNTFFHAVDELLHIPDRLQDQPTPFVLRDYNGKLYRRSVYRHKRSMSDFFMNYEPALVAAGAVTFGKLGDATVRICHAEKCTQVIRKLWEKADHDLCRRYETLKIPCKRK